MEDYGWEMSGIKSFVKKYWKPILSILYAGIVILLLSLKLPFWAGILISFGLIYGIWSFTNYIKKNEDLESFFLWSFFLCICLLALCALSIMFPFLMYTVDPNPVKTVFLIITIFLSVVLTARGLYILYASKPNGETPAADNDKVNGGTGGVKLNFKNLRY